MDKQGFLDMLRQALMGEVPEQVIQENLFYYNGYILDEMKKGRSEAEVLEELGDPRLIARTIIDSENSAGGRPHDFSGPGRTSETVYGGYGQAAGGPGREDGDRRDFRSFDVTGRRLRIAGWVALAVVILILVLVFSVIGGILSLLGPILPVLVLIWLVMWFMRIFRR